MAAAGGDTIVPTNWGGLIVTAIVVAVVAAATYFGMETTFGQQAGPEKEDELSVQQVFSASAERGVEAAEPARVLSRAELAAKPASSQTSAAMPSQDANPDSTASDSDWEVSDSGEDWDATSDDWDTPASDDWDEASSDETAQASSSAADSVAQQVREQIQDTSAAVASSAREVASQASQAASSAIRAAKDALTTPSQPVRQRPSAEALRDWWSDANGDLAIRFAGTLDRGNQVSDGIAVMFSEAVSPAQGQAHMQLSDESGQALAVNWKSARNPNMLIADGLKPGRYQLAIDSALQSVNGQALKKSVSGPVFVY